MEPVDLAAGAYYDTLNNCALSGNRAGYGGGTGRCTLNNCILSSNSAINNLQFISGYGPLD